MDDNALCASVWMESLISGNLQTRLIVFRRKSQALKNISRQKKKIFSKHPETFTLDAGS